MSIVRNKRLRNESIANMPREAQIRAYVDDLVDSAIMPLVRGVILRKIGQIIDYAREQLDSDADAAEADSDSVARDAARYRWLRKLRGIPESVGPSIPRVTRVIREHGMPAMTGCYGEELDAAIDAVLAAKQRQGGSA